MPPLAATLPSLVAARAHLLRRARAEDGLMLIELLVASFVLIVGILGLIMGFDTARRLDVVSERQTSMVQRAHAELERVLSLSYDQVGMTATPSSSTSSANPDYYVNTTGSNPTFQYDPGNTSAVETLDVDSTNGTISATPTAWSDGVLTGDVYDFVTWHTDGSCGSGCPSSQDYKRVTVAVTVNQPSTGKQLKPFFISTLIPDPGAHPAGEVLNGDQNPLSNPKTTCQNATGQTVDCTQGLDSGSANTWFLHDYAASGTSSPSPEPGANHPTHATVAASGTCTSGSTSGCPQPDIMDSNTPSGSTTDPLYDYSSELGTASSLGFSGGRVLAPDVVSCSGTPTTTNNLAGELWVSAPLSSALTLTGYGGMSIWSQTLGGISATITLCVAVYDVPSSITNLTSSGTPATLIGSSTYSPPSWPTSLNNESFSFQFLSTGTYTVGQGHRIGVRVWEATGSSSDIALAYDHAQYPAEVELNSQ